MKTVVSREKILSYYSMFFYALLHPSNTYNELVLSSSNIATSAYFLMRYMTKNLMDECWPQQRDHDEFIFVMNLQTEGLVRAILNGILGIDTSS